MVNPETSFTQQRHSPFTLVQDTGGDWRPPVSFDSTSGGSGGNPLEPRVKVLETSVININKDIGNIKTDVRDIRNYGLTLIGAAFLTITGGIGGLYLYADGKTDALSNDFSALHLDVTKEISSIKNDVNIIKIQNENIVKGVDNLTDTVNKLVGIKLTNNNDNP